MYISREDIIDRLEAGFLANYEQSTEQHCVALINIGYARDHNDDSRKRLEGEFLVEIEFKEDVGDQNGSRMDANFIPANEWQQKIKYLYDRYNGKIVNEYITDMFREAVNQLNAIDAKRRKGGGSWSQVVNERRRALGKFLHFTPKETLQFVKRKGGWWQVNDNINWSVLTDREADEEALETEINWALDRASENDYSECFYYIKLGVFTEERKLTIEQEVRNLKIKEVKEQAEELKLDTENKSDLEVVEAVIDARQYDECGDGEDDAQWYIDTFGEPVFNEFVVSNNLFDEQAWAEDEAENQLRWNGRRNALSTDESEYEVKEGENTFYIYYYG